MCQGAKYEHRIPQSQGGSSFHLQEHRGEPKRKKVRFATDDLLGNENTETGHENDYSNFAAEQGGGRSVDVTNHTTNPSMDFTPSTHVCSSCSEASRAPAEESRDKKSIESLEEGDKGLKEQEIKTTFGGLPQSRFFARRRANLNDDDDLVSPLIATIGTGPAACK